MKIRASHILVDTKEQAENLLLDINNGVAFEDLAKQYSKCPSGRDGGDLRWFGKGMMVKPFAMLLSQPCRRFQKRKRLNFYSVFGFALFEK